MRDGETFSSKRNDFDQSWPKARSFIWGHHVHPATLRMRTLVTGHALHSSLALLHHPRSPLLVVCTPCNNVDLSTRTIASCLQHGHPSMSSLLAYNTATPLTLSLLCLLHGHPCLPHLHMWLCTTTSTCTYLLPCINLDTTLRSTMGNANEVVGEGSG